MCVCVYIQNNRWLGIQWKDDTQFLLFSFFFFQWMCSFVIAVYRSVTVSIFYFPPFNPFFFNQPCMWAYWMGINWVEWNYNDVYYVIRHCFTKQSQLPFWEYHSQICFFFSFFSSLLLLFRLLLYLSQITHQQKKAPRIQCTVNRRQSKIKNCLREQS